MKTFIVSNEDFIKSSKTFLSAAAVASGSPVSMSVDSNNTFSINDYIIIGREGEEKAEIKKITGTPAGQITVATLSFDHKISEPIIEIAFNKRKFYGCITKDGTFVFIETKSIEVDNPQGTFFSYTGTYEWFKATYYNETTAEETDIADAIAAQAGEIQHYCSVYDIREEAGFLENPYISDGRIHLLRLQAESEVKGSLANRYALPLSEIPEVVKTATIMLAAGRLLYREYGSDTEGLAKDGVEKIKEGRSILKAIRQGEIILLKSNDVELASKATANLKGWPDSTTKDATEDESGGKIRIRIKKEF